jgi:hypothetical protein
VSADGGGSFDHADRVADGLIPRRLFVGDVDVELGNEGQDQLDSIERVRAEVAGDRCFHRHRRLVDAEYIDDDFLDVLEGRRCRGSVQCPNRRSGTWTMPAIAMLMTFAHLVARRTSPFGLGTVLRLRALSVQNSRNGPVWPACTR